ncbi:MAG: hypothetical protein E4H19_00800 [Chromatiales bacterium]|jgi:uncharacterized protein (TIGR02001 family)|nr:MAG: hypothetical protein E4H19_00800 [Chromatiales bacterium]
MNRAISSKFAALGVLALVAATGTAQAEVSSTITIASDYDFRGITQNGLDPAFQASLDWEGESGLYAGLWGSNIDFGEDGFGAPEDEDYIAPVDLNVEVDLYLGYAGSITEDLGYDVGATYYKYLGDDDNGLNDFDYFEAYAGVDWKILSTKLWYAWDYGNSGESAWYLEGNAAIPLPLEFSFDLHAGYNGGDYWDTPEVSFGEEFIDWSVGLSRSLGRFDLAVKYIDGSDLKDYDCSRSSVECLDDVFSSESKVFASVSTTFPWTDEE